MRRCNAGRKKTEFFKVNEINEQVEEEGGECARGHFSAHTVTNKSVEYVEAKHKMPLPLLGLWWRL
jgi:hypothetical protein